MGRLSLEKEKRLTRRGFLSGLMFTFGTVIFLDEMIGTTFAEMVDPTKGIAKTLKYVEDAVAAKKAGTIDAKYEEGQNCQNCFYYTGDENMGTCLLVKPGNVSAQGWCKSFTPKDT